MLMVVSSVLPSPKLEIISNAIEQASGPLRKLIPGCWAGNERSAQLVTDSLPLPWLLHLQGTRTTTTKCHKQGRLNPRISLQLLPPAFWPPSHGYLPRHSWWCRRGLPETLLQSTSLAFLLFGPDGSNRRCKSSWTSQSLPRTPSCRPVACQVETGSERAGEAQFALLTDKRSLMLMPSAGWPLKHIVCNCLSLLQIKERQERKA